MGHCGLASGLFLVGKHVDGCCSYCGVSESVTHVLLRCPSYEGERRKMFSALSDRGVTTFSLKTVLGYGVSLKERVNEVMCFLKNTGLYVRI